MKKSIALVALLGVAVFAQQKGSFTDPRDKKTYQTVKIGNQIWMAQNLDYHGTDGFLGLCNGDEPRRKISKPENCQKYGRLYEWEAAMKACPAGWHLPSESEYEALFKAVGGHKVAGRKLKSKSGWNYNGNGTDEYGFSALPGGVGDSDGNFGHVGFGGFWWSTGEYGGYNIAYPLRIYYNEEYTHWDNRLLYKLNLLSVRCLQYEVKGKKEETSQVAKETFTVAKETFTDSRDGKKYKAVKIDKQTWMAENLNYNTSDSKCYENKDENCSKYGRLYNWETAMKACPKGWHLPSKGEYEALDNTIGGHEEAGRKLKSKSGWNENGNGTDNYGFSALPGGGRSDGSFGSVGRGGLWWSASENNSDRAYSRLMSYISEGAHLLNYDKSDLFSVRCLQD